MYYDRTLKTEFSKLIEPNGSLRWLYDYVKKRDDLDFQIGKSGSLGNNGGHGKKEWISVYRGLTRILAISPTRDPNIIKLDAAHSYKVIMPDLYGKKAISYNFQNDIDLLINEITKNKKFDRYYKNKKEGFYQNVLSRKFGISGDPHTNFVIIDKEAVVGYKDQSEKKTLFNTVQAQYKQLQKLISVQDPKRFGKDLGKKAIGNELDFLALDKEGNILLIEYKHGTNTSGIYLSPLQIGLYYEIFTSLPRQQLEKAVYAMFDQKQKIGLINAGWIRPAKLRDIIPVLIISEYKSKSSAKIKFDEISQITKSLQGMGFLKHLQTFNFTLKNGLTQW